MYESFKFNKMSKEFRYVGLQEHEMANLCLHPTNFVPKGTGPHVHTSGTQPMGLGLVVYKLSKVSLQSFSR